jgi:UDP-N-acetylmuramate--alanine ligase
VSKRLSMGRIQHIHFIGIGGVGMSGIAEVLFHEGYSISGSDVSDNPAMKRLAAFGIQTTVGHVAANVEGVDVVVVSSAISSDNPELMAAKVKNIPVVPRAEMLSELMRFRYGIAVAGTHGKTTTTSLLATTLADGGLDPTFVIGGKLTSIGGNAHVGSSQYLVAEADESDASFLHLNPMIAIITNIDEDHLVNYQGQFERVKEAFIEFLYRLPFYGLAIVCVDDPVVREILPKVSRPIVTYGFSQDADYQIKAFTQSEETSSFIVKTEDKSESFTLTMPGRHNALNATAVFVVAKELEVAATSVNKTFSNFEGVGRRFQRHGDFQVKGGGITFVDDYGHHPSELQATLMAAKECWPTRRLVLVFQPHRYSRTQDLFHDFCMVLSTVECLLLLDVHPAGEKEIPTANSQSLCEAISQRYQKPPVLVGPIDNLEAVLARELRPGDVMMTMGAGSIGAKVQALLEDNFSAVTSLSMEEAL